MKLMDMDLADELWDVVQVLVEKAARNNDVELLDAALRVGGILVHLRQEEQDVKEEQQDEGP